MQTPNQSNKSIIIHSVRYAVGANASGTSHALGPYCKKPKKSTGAGDRFNAGYALGLILDLPLEDSLRVAVFCSGFFVREGRSATFSELVQFIRDSEESQ